MKKDIRFVSVGDTSVAGLYLVFLAILLIARILIERYYSSSVFEEDTYKSFVEEYRTLRYGEIDEKVFEE